MTAASDELYRTIQTGYFNSTEKWGKVNMTLPGGQQLQSVVDTMVDEKFGGFNAQIQLTIGTKQYYAYVLEPQNKHQRSEKAYGAGSYAGAESYVNLRIKESGTKKVKLNMHILLRTLAAEARIEREIMAKTPDEDGWITPNPKRT